MLSAALLQIINRYSTLILEVFSHGKYIFSFPFTDIYDLQVKLLLRQLSNIRWM